MPPPRRPDAAHELPPRDRYLKFVTNEKRLVALRKRFEKYTGPVTNTGGVR